jgi:hypothetical protein
MAAPAPQNLYGDPSGTQGAPTNGAALPSTPTEPAQVVPNQSSPGQPAYGSPPSGFADGGIFTGNEYAGADHLSSEPFDGIPSNASTFAPQGYGTQPPPHPGPFPPRDLEPLDVTPVPPGGHPAPGYGYGPGVADGLSSMLPGDDDDGGRRGRRRRAKSEGKRRSSGTERGAFDALTDARSDEAPVEHRASGSRRVVALLGAVAVLGAAGYLGYSQLAGTDQAVSSPVVPKKPVVASPKSTLPTALANLTEITPAQAKALATSYTTLSAKNLPTLPVPLTVTAYHPQNDPRTTVNVVVYKAGVRGTYETLVGSLSRPSPGNAAIAAVPVAPGAAGGQMLCGSQRGASSTAWCAWSSTKGVGFLSTKGTANPTLAAIYTRELRAYAER